MLWGVVSGSDRRIPEEFELALLLVGLSDGQYDPAETLLLQIASSPDESATWTVALAKRLRQLGPLLKDEQDQLSRALISVLASAVAEPSRNDPRLSVEVQ